LWKSSSFYAAYVFIKMKKPAGAIRDVNANSFVNRRMMAGVLGGGPDDSRASWDLQLAGCITWKLEDLVVDPFHLFAM
jgi:hypothetical protein